MKSIVCLLLLTATAAAQPMSPGTFGPNGPNDPDEERAELNELRFKLRELERRLDVVTVPPSRRVAAEAAAAAASAEAAAAARPAGDPGPRFHFGRDGFAFGTADGKNEIRFHAVLHVDGRFYFDQNTPNSFVIRRARPYIDGTLFGIVDFRLMTELAPGQPIILDAYLDLHPFAWLRLRAGRFRSPFGLEFLQSDSSIALIERSLATDLVPLRDTGAMLWGDIAGGTLSYAVAALNGAADLGNGPDLATSSNKDFVGRIFLRPLKPIRRLSAVDLGLGVAASYGKPHATAAATGLPVYKSTGQVTIFSYLATPLTPDATAIAYGQRWRVSPQLYLDAGPFGLLAEYVMSSQRVQRLGEGTDVENHAWNVTVSFVVTLERHSYDRIIPTHPVDFRHLALGAFELVARYSELRIDGKAFPTYADAEVSVRSAREFAGGLNWHLTAYTKFMLSFQRTDFDGGAAPGGDRKPENALLGRLQIAL
jgi:phosphate-selective porin OprO and OprP